ncbi:MAG: acetate/propionate family kinase [Alphaproteobacteria bacterium]
MMLILNAGSSSLKVSVYHKDSLDTPKLSVQVDRLTTQPTVKVKGDDFPPLPPLGVGHAAVLSTLLPWFFDAWPIDAVGHRVVYGGVHFADPVVVTDSVLEILETLIPLAPLHQLHNLFPMRWIKEHLPQKQQVACFDTAFHRTQTPLATWFALPRRYHDQGVQRYGFHGLSYHYISQQLPTITQASRVIVAHLGNGASLCALKDGKSYDTTMGFSALDGLMMGTRSGSVDAGVILHLLHEKTPDEFQDMLYKESGLLGVSGISHDMRTLLESPHPHAQQAVDLYVYHILREMGALTAALGGVQAIVFTAGIGENAPVIRQRVCEGLAFFGVALDEKANAVNDVRLHHASSTLEVFCLPTNEERIIAKATAAMV